MTLDKQTEFQNAVNALAARYDLMVATSSIPVVKQRLNEAGDVTTDFVIGFRSQRAS